MRITRGARDSRIITLAAIMLLGFGGMVEARISASTRHLDKYINTTLKAEGIKPSKQSSDAEFLRRVHLDLTGKIPTVEQVLSFLEDGSKNKREKKIDELLGSEPYLDNWTRIWLNWLVGRGGIERRMELSSWIRNALARNLSYDRFVAALITAEGKITENGAGGFLLRYDLSPIDLTAHTSRLFLGLPMQCAQCHDHKTEVWLQEDFYSIAAFFATTEYERIYRKDDDGEEEEIDVVLRDIPRGSVYIPDSEEETSPRFLDGERYKGSPTKRRRALSQWMTSKENPYFSNAIVNRIWAHFMGKGFVEPLDGFGEEYPAIHPELLDSLANDLVAHNYDLQYFMRTILNSQAYQRTSATNKSNADDETHYSHAYVKPLKSEQFFYSMIEATGFDRLQKRRDRDALERMKRDYLERFIFLLANGEMEELEAFNGTVPQALMMINGPLVNDSGDHKTRGSLIHDILKRWRTTADRVEQIYLRTLSRPPTSSEQSYFKRYENSSLYRDKELPYEDLYWALLNSAEFALNH